MAEETFADLGRVEAISKLYEGTPYKPFESSWFETSSKGFITSHSRTFIEGIDFDLTYFPLKHLGYKCVVGVVGELYAALAHPKLLNVILGLSAKMDLEQVYVESSGLADPSNMGEILEAVKLLAGDVYEFKGVICLID